MEEDKADVSLLENGDRCDIFCERNQPIPPEKLLIETILAKETANTREKGTLDTELWSIILKWNEPIRIAVDRAGWRADVKALCPPIE